jgi:hypothetical protein
MRGEVRPPLTSGATGKTSGMTQSRAWEPETTTGQEPVVVGLRAAPGLVHDLAEHIARDLPDRLRERFGGVDPAGRIRRRGRVGLMSD